MDNFFRGFWVLARILLLIGALFMLLGGGLCSGFAVVYGIGSSDSSILIVLGIALAVTVGGGLAAWAIVKSFRQPSAPADQPPSDNGQPPQPW